MTRGSQRQPRVPDALLVVLAWLCDLGDTAFRLARRAAGGRPVAAVRAALAQAVPEGRRAVGVVRRAAPEVADVARRSWRLRRSRLPRVPVTARAAVVTAVRAAPDVATVSRCRVHLGARSLRPVAVPAVRAAEAVLPRAGAALTLLALAGWFAPGPFLGAAARLTAVDESPFPRLPQRSVVTAADGTPLGVVHGGENRAVVRLGEVPAVVRRLIVLAEDRRFFEHDGFDQSAIVRAALANARRQGVTQGASTITQQLVKRNLVGGDRSPARKVRELVLSVAVERTTTKGALLARYLNEVYFGNGAYGIAAAAETYFGVEPSALRPEQAALLATMIRSPSGLDPWRAPERARSRRDVLLRAAGADGVLTRGAAEEMAGAPLGVLPEPRRPPSTNPDLVRAVEAEIARRPELGATPAERLRRFRSGGWSVETTVDPELQDAAATAADRHSSAVGAAGAAVAAVEPGTGRIRALYSRRPPGLDQLDLATAGRRQPGSAFKPVAAIAALEAGLDPLQPLEGRNGVRFPLLRETWEVHNFDEADHPPPDLATALRESVNSAFAQVGVAVGADDLADVAGRLGVDVDAALGPPSERGPALALGGLRHGVTPLELAGAYAAIAADGRYATPTLLGRIVGPDGREVLRLGPVPRQALDPATNASVRSMLRGVVTGGTGTGAAIPGRDAFGKTGTSQDRADAWFVGAVPELAAAVWVGDPRARTPMPAATGGTVAAPVWRQVMVGVPPAMGTAFAPAPPLPPRPPLSLPVPQPPSR